MKYQSCYVYIQIGLCIRCLANVSSSDSKKYTLDHIEMLGKAISQVGFEVSMSGGHAIKAIKEKIIKLDDGPVGSELASELCREMAVFERIIFAESGTKHIFITDQSRFNFDYLMNHPEKLLHEGMYEKLDEISRYGIKHGAKCLVAGEATATAFHILRATEGVLKSYYFKHIRRNRIEKPMWGPMTQGLRNKQRNKPSTVLLDSLDLVRRSYRNPTQHPDAVYNIDQAQDLFGVCLDLINKMSDEL